MSTILSLHDPADAKRYYADGTWRHDTVYALVRHHALTRPDGWALRDATRRLTWAQLRDWVVAVADDLHEAGVRRGQRVGGWLPNRVEAVVAFLACSRNGYVVTPSLHRNHTTAQIVQLMRRVSAAALIVQPGYGSDSARADIVAEAKTIDSLRRLYSVEPVGPGGDAVAFPPQGTAPRRLIVMDRNPDKIVYLAFTSGTTGEPKGVMHSDNTLLANGRPMVADWKFGPDTVILSLSPMSHHIGTVAIEQMLACGGELVLDDPPPGKSRLHWIAGRGGAHGVG